VHHDDASSKVLCMHAASSINFLQYCNTSYYTEVSVALKISILIFCTLIQCHFVESCQWFTAMCCVHL